MATTDTPILVTNTDDLRRMFDANISGWFAANGIGLDSSRLAASLIEILRANCPPPANRIDALGGLWMYDGPDVYSDEDNNHRRLVDIENDPELGPTTIAED